MPDITEKFSTNLKTVLTRALVLAVERGESSVYPTHLLWAMGTQKGCIGRQLLERAHITEAMLTVLIDGPREHVSTERTITLHLSNEAKRVLEKAVLSANTHGHAFVGTEHLIFGLLNAGGDAVEAFFAKQAVNLPELRNQTAEVLKNASKIAEIVGTSAKTEEAKGAEVADQKKTPALDFFGRDLTTEELQSRIDPVIGRESEIERVMEILCRRTKNNPLLLGEPGVGKTAIVEGLAKRIMSGDVPAPLRGKRLVALDLPGLIAGTMYRGEFEQRLRQVMEEARKEPDLILFVDEMHTIVGAGSAGGSMDAANMLKPALARGDIRLIGATTHAEFKKHIEADAALERRFQTVTVEEPTVARALDIVHGLTPHYEKYHGVAILPEAVNAAVELSVRHLFDKKLPDKAIDLLDEAAAGVRVRARIPAPADARRLAAAKLEEVRDAKRLAVVEERFMDAVALKREEDRLAKELEIPTSQTFPTSPTLTVGVREVAGVVSRRTGIPLTDLMQEEQEALLTLEAQLREHVIGQDVTVKTVASAIRRAKAGLAAPKRPLASFLFLGPSGVGKTELARSLAQTLFKDPKALIRLDMSEFSESFTASKLVGSPAGYVGYREGAKLTDAVRSRPHAVVLFDEIEKAHKDVQNLLLQILEEGELADATGRSVSFRQAVIVLTSNVGLERFGKVGIGFAGSIDDAKTSLTADVREELMERFRPELVNRLDHLCMFSPLSEDILTTIATRQLSELAGRLQERGVELRWNEEIPKHLVKNVDQTVGARDIRRKLIASIESPLADRLIACAPKRIALKLRGDAIELSEPRR